MSKSILFVCADYGGGIAKMLRYVMGICVDIFDDITLVHRGRESASDIIPIGVSEIVLPSSVGKTMPVWRFNHIRSIRQIIKEKKPDIVCAFGSEIAVMTSMSMIGIKGPKLLLAERGDPYTLPLKWKILLRLSYLKANNGVFQLKAQGEWFGRSVMKRSRVIPNAYIPTGAIPSYSGARKKEIVSVGRFVPEKRYEILIKSFAEVHKIHPEYSLCIYGDGPSRAIYEDLINEYGLESCVRLPGYTNNSMESIKDASVFVLSSLYEGMPNTLIEALVCGVPIVSTNCTPGGPSFLTDNGRRGLLVPVDDVKAMSGAICSIIENPQLAEDLSAQGVEVAEELNDSKIKLLWKEYFQYILANR